MAATAAFSRRGFDGGTIRAIAADAGVDPALVLHYFRSKRDLFIEAVALPFEPEAAIERIFASGPGGAGRELVSLALDAWDSTAQRPVMLTLLRSAVTDEVSAALFRRRLAQEILEPIVRHLGSDRPDWRAALAGAHLAGLGMARFIVRIEPLASASSESVIEAAGPVIQHYLTGDLGGQPLKNGGDV